jgi:hypothetical protein
MFNKSRISFLPINRNKLIALSPIIFLLLLFLWTLLNIGLTPVKAAPATTTPFAVVRRASANIRRGPGMEYGIFGTVRKGAVLPVSGQYINSVGEHWYKVYLKAFGNAWVSGLVVDISPANATIPTVGLTSAGLAESTVMPATAEAPVTNNSIGTGNNPGNIVNYPPSNPNPAPQQPAPVPQTTPELNG